MLGFKPKQNSVNSTKATSVVNPSISLPAEESLDKDSVLSSGPAIKDISHDAAINRGYLETLKHLRYPIITVALVVLGVTIFALLREDMKPGSSGNRPNFTQLNADLGNATKSSDNTTLQINVDTLVKNPKNSSNIFLIQSASGESLFRVDGVNREIEVNGDIVSNGTILLGDGTSLDSEGLRINNVLVCDARGCIARPGADSAIDLNNIDAGNITSGTLSDSRLSSAVTLQGNIFNGPNQLVKLDSSGQLPPGVVSGSFAQLNANQTFSGDNIFSSASNSFTGNGAGLASLNATNVSSGTLSDARLSANVTLQGNTFNGVNQLVRLDGSGNLPALNASALTSLNASNISSGTVSDARLSSNVSLLNANQTFSGNNTFSSASNSFTGNGSGLTSLNASNLSSGTVNDGRLSANVALLNGNQTFSGNNTFNNAISTSGITTSGASLGIGASAAVLNLTGSLSSNLAVTNGTNTITVGFNGTPVGNVNYNFDNTVAAGTYTICTTIGNCAGSGTGVTTPGGTTNALAKFTGSQAIGDSIISDNGTTVTIGGTLAVNTISPTATLAVGVASQTLTLQGDGSTSLRATVGGITNVLAFAAPSGSGKTITIPNASGTVAVSASGPLSLDANGNLTCAGCLTGGGGGGVAGVTSVNTLTDAITLAGTANQIVITPSGQTLTFSTPQDINTSSTPTFANINVASGGQFRLNGTQISSGVLSNDSNLAKLNGNQTFSGNNTFTGTILHQNASNSTTAFQIQNAAGSSNLFIADTTNSRVAIGATPATSLLTIGTNTTAASGGITFGTDTSLYRSGVASLRTDGELNVFGPTLTLNGGFYQGIRTNGTDAFFKAQTGTDGFYRFESDITGKLLWGDGSAAGDTTLYRSAANTLKTDDNLLITTATNSASAFQVQSASAAETLFTANTNTRTGVVAGNIIKVGNDTGGDADVTILVVDSTNTAGVPSTNLSSLNGGLFYNSQTHKMSIIENGAVKILCNQTDASCGGNSTTLQQAYTASTGGTTPEVKLDATRGGLDIQDADSTITASLFAVRASNGSGLGTAMFDVASSGLISLQPAASLTAGQNHISQTLTNASSTGGTVTGYDQAITVAPTSSAATTRGINIAFTDNTSLANTNIALRVDLTGTNTNANSVGVSASSNRGIGVRGTSNTSLGSGNSCGNASGSLGIGVCGDTSFTNNATGTTAGVYGRNNVSTNTNSLTSTGGSGVYGVATADSAGTGGVASNYYVGVKGQSKPTANAAYTSVGVYGDATGGASSNIYGGYFTVQSTGSSASAALYASNSTTTSNILNLQDNTTSVMTVADGGAVTLQNSTNSNGAFAVMGQAGNTVLVVDTANDLGRVGIGNDVTPSAILHVGTDQPSTPLLLITDQTGTDVDVLTIANEGATTFRNRTDSATAFQIQNASGNNNLFLVNTTHVNLVGNSSAESDGTGWAINTGSGSAPVSSTTYALYGNASLAINTSATLNAGAKYDTATLLSAATTYSLSFWAKIASGSFTVEAGSSDTDVFGGEAACGLSSTSVTTTWTRFTCSFTVGAITTGGYIFIRQSDSTSRTWYVDGIQLEQAANPTVYREGSLQLNGTVTSPTTFKNSQDTATAFQIQNAAGTSLFTVNTASTAININADTTLAAGKFLAITGGATGTRPSSPAAGMLYYDSTTNQILQYNGTKWVSDRTTSTKIVAASNSSQAAKDAADYVADGTGDQTEINNALTAAAGGSVYLMEGTYVANATILIPNNTTLAGAGRGTLIELADLDATDNLIENSDTSTGTGVVIRDIRLDGRSDLNTAGTQHGISFNGMGGGSGASARPGSKITNIFVNRFRSYGIYLTSSSNSTISGSTAQANNDGIRLDTSTSNITLTNNIAQGNTAYGFTLFSSTSRYHTLSGNVAEGNSTAGFLLSSSTDNTLSGNTARNSTIGIYVFSSSNNSISGNLTEGNSYGIQLFSSSNNNAISVNTVQNNGTSGIDLESSSNNNVLTSNKVNNNGGATNNDGLRIEASDFNSVIGNHITDTSCTTSCYAINIVTSTSDKNYLEGNRFSGSAANAASINEVGTNTIYVNQQMNSTTSTNNDVSDFNFRGSTNSSTAFQIQNAGGAPLLSIDTTTNNLITNGSFEVDTTGWSAKISLSTGVVRQTTNAINGSASASFTTSATAGSGVRYTTFALSSNTMYNFSAQVRTNYGTVAANTIVLGFQNTANQTDTTSDNDCATTPAITTGWTLLSCTFTTGTVTGGGVIYLKQTDSTSRALYIDSAQLTLYSQLTNPSIEQAISGNWTAKNSATVTQDNTQAYVGTNSLKIVTTTAATDGARQNITLTTSTSYTMSFYAKLDGASAALTTMEAGYSSDGSTDGNVCITGQTVVTTGWTKYTCTLVTPASNSGTPFIYVKHASATAHTFYVDSVQLIKGQMNDGYQDGRITLNGIISNAVTLQNANDSTGAFQVQNSMGVALFKVDTANSEIILGGSLLPNTAGAIDIGSTALEFNNIYVGDNNGLTLGLDQDAKLAYDEATDDRTELTGAGASLFIEDRLGLGVQVFNISGDSTLTPTSSYVRIHCDNGGVGCAITMGEGSAKEGDVVLITSACDALTFSDTTGVSELSGAFTMHENDVLMLIYNMGQWIEVSRSDNSISTPLCS